MYPCCPTPTSAERNGARRSAVPWKVLELAFFTAAVATSSVHPESIPVHPRGRLVRLIPALFVALLPLTLFGQSPVQREATTTSWADGILKAEGYAVPPKDLADAVLAP